MRRRHRTTRVGIVILALMLISSCGFNPDRIALPEPGAGDRNELRIEFASVVNLPQGANVVSKGIRIGRLESITLGENSADLEVSVDASVPIPASTRAELRQTSMLGDIFIALIPPTGDLGPILGDGATIPLSQTDPGPQVEEIIKNLAEFINGGSVLRMQDALADVNRAVDSSRSPLRAVSTLTAEDIAAASASTDEFDRILKSLQDMTGAMAAKPAQLSDLMSESGGKRFVTIVDAVTAGLQLVFNISPLTTGLLWTVPRLAQLQPFLSDVVPLLRTYSQSATTANGNIGAASDLVSQKLVPFVENGPSLSVGQVTVDGGSNEQTEAVVAVLRMIGALR